MNPSECIERFLATGEVDLDFPGFDGRLAERRQRGVAVLDDVVRRVLRWRLHGAPLAPVAPPEDAAAEIAARFGPVARGVLPGDVAERFLAVLPARVEVVTPERFLLGIEGVSLELRWTLANMLLDDMGAPPLSDLAPQLDGFCERGRAWVTASTFVATRWSDPLVHECAHLLHGAGVLGAGAPPVLPVAAERHELLAYGCELWTCLQRQQGPLSERLAEFDATRPVSDPGVRHEELREVLESAGAADDAWRVIKEAALAS